MMSNKFDPNSDTIFSQLSGTCQDCMVLKANQLTSNKNGVWQGVEQGIYTHHFATMATGKAQMMNPVMPKCGGFDLSEFLGPIMSGGRASGPTSSSNGVSVFIGKGNDDAPMVFASKDPKVKSGYYLGKNSKILLSGELNNYQPRDRDIYISLDYEFVQTETAGQKPRGYLEVGFGSMGVDCNLIKTLGKVLRFKSLHERLHRSSALHSSPKGQSCHLQVS